MPLPFHPRPGTIVVCDYSKGGFRAPEMTKPRLAVVISPKLKRRNDLATVVPLSATQPANLENWHVQVNIAVPLPWGEIDRWAKCDMMATVGYDRLNLPHYRHAVTGTRQFWQHTLADEQVAALRRATAAALGIDVAE